MEITQAVLPVAGLGTRFLPWTKAVPKELLPLGSRPIIAELVNECLDCGVSDICFVIAKGKEAIPQYFAQDTCLEEELQRRGKLHLLEELQRYDSVRFTTVYQHDQLGDGHALLQAAEWVRPGHIAVLFGDDLFVEADTALRQLLNAFILIEDSRFEIRDSETEEPESPNSEFRIPNRQLALIALQNVPREDVSRYGIATVESEDPQDARLKKITGLVEKPKPEEAPSTFGIVGRYIIPSSIFATLRTMRGDHKKELRLIDALINRLSDLPIYGYECAGTRLDTGYPEGYREAVKHFV